MTCQQCAAKDAVIEQQQKEITRLRAIVKLAQTTCSNIISNAENTMNRGGIPRGQWSYLKGQKEAAGAVFDVLE